MTLERYFTGYDTGNSHVWARMVMECGTLTPRERDVLCLRFSIGPDTGRAHTLEEIGWKYQISRERVRQIEIKATHKVVGWNLLRNKSDI
jgi:DNA-directed RNA polymerase sigma subunit (sigma70/sigma32)